MQGVMWCDSAIAMYSTYIITAVCGKSNVQNI